MGDSGQGGGGCEGRDLYKRWWAWAGVPKGVGKVRKGVGKVPKGVGKVPKGVGKVPKGVGKVPKGVRKGTPLQ